MSIDLRLGRYQDVLADVECDALICDPPYSARTHCGQRTGSSIRMPTIAYEAVDRDWCLRFCESWGARTRNWAVIFCDHTAFRWHEEAWDAAGWLTFAPVMLKENPTPRFSGDGPAFALEFLLVARPRRRDVEPRGSFPAYYQTDSGGDRRGRTVAGAKPLELMRAIVRDYSRPGDLVCDPCAGGATTLLAAAMEGRRAIGAEMDPVTFAKAQARIAKGWTPPLFVDGGKAAEQLEMDAGE